MATATKEKPAKAPKAEKAPAADAADKPKRTVKSGADRRARGWLENDVKLLCEKFSDGSIPQPTKEVDGKTVKLPITPHRLAKMIQADESLDEPPSTGAVAAVFGRWQALGFALFNDKPFSFKAFSAEGKRKGLDEMKAEKREALFAAKRAEREANPKPKKATAKKAPAAKKAAASKAS